MSRVDLRRARYDCADAVALTEAAQHYYRGIYGGPDTSPIDVDEFDAPHGAFLVAYWDDVPVAMGGWRFLRHDPPIPARRAAEIRRMFVLNSVRRQGVARSLLLELESDAVAASADVMVLETGTPQRDAIAFYRRCGYVDVPHFGYYADAPGAVHLGKRMPHAEGI